MYFSMSIWGRKKVIVLLGNVLNLETRTIFRDTDGRLIVYGVTHKSNKSFMLVIII